jgi:hypothetical protein
MPRRLGQKAVGLLYDAKAATTLPDGSPVLSYDVIIAGSGPVGYVLICCFSSTRS